MTKVFAPLFSLTRMCVCVREWDVKTCNLRKDPVKTGQRTSREVKIGMAWQETSHMYCCCGIFYSNALTSLD